MARLVLVPFVLAAVVLTSGCGREEKPAPGQTPAGRAQQGAQKVTGGAQEVAEGAAEWAAATKEQLVKQAGDRVAALNAKMDALEEEARGMGTAAQQKWETELRPELQKSIQDAEAKLNEVKESAGDAWKDLNAGVQQRIDKLNAAFDAAKKELEKK
jgi:hypothetical protein